jgi:hypothetical protein
MLPNGNSSPKRQEQGGQRSAAPPPAAAVPLPNSSAKENRSSLAKVAGKHALSLSTHARARAISLSLSIFTEQNEVPCRGKLQAVGRVQHLAIRRE